MLTVCFDVGRNPTSEGVIVVAGFCGEAKVWTEFDKEWNNRLQADGLTFFHAGDFAFSNGEFKQDWRENETRRRALARDLMDIITRHGLRKFGAVVPLVIHNEIQQDIRDRNFTAYVHGALSAVDHFNSYAHSIRAERVKYVFEKGEREDELRQRFRDDGYQEPFFTWKKPHRDRKGFIEDGFLGLQAAGWIAYEYYVDIRNTADLGKPITQKSEEGRWAFQQFENMLGIIQMPVSHDSAEMVIKIRDETRYLEGLKPKPRRGVS